MKLQLNIILLVILGIIGYHVLFHEENEIAIVNTVKVLKEYKSLKIKIEEYERINSDRKSNQDTLVSEIQRLMLLYEKNRGTNSKDEQTNVERELQKKQEQYQNYAIATQEAMKNEESKVIEEALKMINSAIEQYASEKNIKVIYSAAPGGSIAYYNQILDISDEIIRIVNK